MATYAVAMSSDDLEVPIRGESIRLGQLLKFAGVVDDGATAREAIERGLVEVNGVVETRRGAQCRVGDEVRYAGALLHLTPS